MGEYAATAIEPPDDTHGSSEYRVKLLRVMIERALTKAVQRATRAAA